MNVDWIPDTRGYRSGKSRQVLSLLEHTWYLQKQEKERRIWRRRGRKKIKTKKKRRKKGRKKEEKEKEI